MLDRSLFSVQVFGKTLENVRKRVNVKLLRSDEEEKILKLVAKPTFAQQVIFNEHLVGIQNHKEKVLLNKPIYVGMSVLDLSKHLMYDFYYNTLKARYGDKIRLLYTDTDSLIVHVQTDDLYKDMAQNLDDYDTSNYSPGHPLFYRFFVDGKQIKTRETAARIVLEDDIFRAMTLQVQYMAIHCTPKMKELNLCTNT